MNWYEKLIFGLNFVGAVVAVVINIVAAGRRGMSVFRRTHVAIATLAAIYAGGYLWFFLADPTVELWSSIFRGVSLVAWVCVWWAPAAMSIQVRSKLAAALNRRLEDRS